MVPLLIPAVIGLTGFAVGTMAANATQPDVIVENASVGVTTQKALIYGAMAIGVFYVIKRLK